MIWFMTKDIMAASTVLVAAGAFAYYGKREPRELQYSLDQLGLTIGQNFMITISSGLFCHEGERSASYCPVTHEALCAPHNHLL